MGLLVSLSSPKKGFLSNRPPLKGYRVALAGCRVPAGAACVQRLRRRLLQCGLGSQTRLGTVVEESAPGVNQLNPGAKVLLGSP